MWKKKPGLDHPDWDWFNRRHGLYYKWSYFRCPVGRRAWVSQRIIDLIESREEGLLCAVRVRDRFHLPEPWDDRGRSRGWRVTSWKDKTRKRKQWER